ncbi:hypothetical protein EOD42_22295 [Rhodovarius crocodyli]|uniref:Uncharacterized protein n=1 Tax=Rhodovarius crocodyli TaxID=1979269 RepID=A0A437M141_9PROT|nr:hypothetical protein [Rhodovarius crocodyli]RVT91388.1 hypothetical protein EOD42_22295 [Rhodovarius crocodyli]
MKDMTEAVETFLRAYPEVRPYQFGRKALGDPKFVAQVRSGRLVRPDTFKKVSDWMAAYAAKRRDDEKARRADRHRMEKLAGLAAPTEELSAEQPVP